MNNFYSSAPTPETAWRILILMGSNTRTYKFALGHALLKHASPAAHSVSLEALANTYALELAKHSEFPQAPKIGSLGEHDFLAILERERKQTLKGAAATSPLLQSAMKSMPAMVLQKFQNVPSGFPQVQNFYSLENNRGVEIVHFSDDLLAVASASSRALLLDELNARWNIVEASFHPELSMMLRSQGVIQSQDTNFLEVLRSTSGNGLLRRPSIAKLRDSISGFQEGRCFHCATPLERAIDIPHVDHVIPRSLITRGLLRDDYWRALNLDHIWNLVVSCAPCNLKKSNSPPSRETLNRLQLRNDLILKSPHPLKQTIRLVTGTSSQKFYSVLVQQLNKVGGISATN